MTFFRTSLIAANVVVFSATGTTSVGGRRAAGGAGDDSLPGQPAPRGALWLGHLAVGNVRRQVAVGVNNVQAEDEMKLRRIPLIFFLDQKMVPVARPAGHRAVSRRRPFHLGGAGRPRDFPAPQGRPAAAHHPDRRRGPHARPLPAGPGGLVAGQLRQRDRLRRRAPAGHQARAGFARPGRAPGVDWPHRPGADRALSHARRHAQPRRGGDAGRAGPSSTRITCGRCRR